MKVNYNKFTAPLIKINKIKFDFIKKIFSISKNKELLISIMKNSKLENESKVIHKIKTRPFNPFASGRMEIKTSQLIHFFVTRPSLDFSYLELKEILQTPISIYDISELYYRCLTILRDDKGRTLNLNITEKEMEFIRYVSWTSFETSIINSVAISPLCDEILNLMDKEVLKIFAKSNVKQIKKRAENRLLLLNKIKQKEKNGISYSKQKYRIT